MRFARPQQRRYDAFLCRSLFLARCAFTQTEATCVLPVPVTLNVQSRCARGRPVGRLFVDDVLFKIAQEPLSGAVERRDMLSVIKWLILPFRPFLT